MDEIAADAERRAKARKQRKHESDLLKIKGNEKLSAGDLEGAYKLYSEGLDIMKDNLPLWTNRAQVLIKLNRFPEAIEDCDFAFRIDETCMKAFVHKSKALAYLGKFDDARNCLQESLDAENSAARKKTVAEYLDLIDEIEKKADLDVKASEVRGSVIFSSLIFGLESLRFALRLCVLIVFIGYFSITIKPKRSRVTLLCERCLDFCSFYDQTFFRLSSFMFGSFRDLNTCAVQCQSFFVS